MRQFILTFSLWAVLVSATPAFGQATVVDLGTLAGTLSEAKAVNAGGVVVGYSAINDFNTIHAVRWSRGRIADLGTLCGEACPFGTSEAWDINDEGQIVGRSAVDEFDTASGFLWDPATRRMTALPPLPGDFGSAAHALNDRGQIVGVSSGPLGNRAVMWRKVRRAWIPFELGALGVDPDFGLINTTAYDINNKAQVVGFSANDTGCTGFIWQDGVIAPLIDLSSTLCLNSANGINRRGDVAGTIAADFALHAATWSEGTITDLGVLTPSGQTFSPHHGINDRGVVSGSGHLDEFGCVFTGAAWTAGDVVILPALSTSCSINFAYGINNRGQIAGAATTDTGEFHAVLWTIDTEPPVVNVGTLTPRLPPSGKKRVPVAFSGRITDEGSGIASATYRIVDEYGTVEPSGAVELDDDGCFLVVVQLEPSRRGNDRDGRLYRLVVTATDNAGNESSNTASVIILHDQRRDD